MPEFLSEIKEYVSDSKMVADLMQKLPIYEISNYWIICKILEIDIEN